MVNSYIQICKPKEIYDFVVGRSKKAAEIIKNDILNKTREIIFINQYQQDEFEPSFRRIIVRDYKILYFLIENTFYFPVFI